MLSVVVKQCGMLSARSQLLEIQTTACGLQQRVHDPAYTN